MVYRVRCSCMYHCFRLFFVHYLVVVFAPLLGISHFIFDLLRCNRSKLIQVMVQISLPKLEFHWILIHNWYAHYPKYLFWPLRFPTCLFYTCSEAATQSTASLHNNVTKKLFFRISIFLSVKSEVKHSKHLIGFNKKYWLWPLQFLLKFLSL